MSRTTKDERQGDMFALLADPPDVGQVEQKSDGLPHDQPPSRAMRWAELEEEEAIATMEAEADHPADELDDCATTAEEEREFTTQPVASELPRDELGEAIIAAELAPNDYLLRINRTISPSYDAPDYGDPWNLPSRMFRFPIETHEPERGPDGQDYPRVIGLMHPLLADHPFVKEVEAKLGFEISREPVANAYGYSKARTALWWHAVDLASAGRIDDLMRTRQFTTPDDIMRALVFGMRYGPDKGRKAHVDPITARSILADLGADRPDDTDAALEAMSFDEFKGEKGKLQRAINGPHRCSAAAEAWAWIEAVECGWIVQGRYATFTDAALERRKATLL